jgi:hypothetical protein
MRKLFALCLALVAACGGSAFKEQARDAMPDSNGVKMGPPEAQPSSSALSKESASNTLVGADPWYNLTVAYSFAINAGTAWTLGVVQAVVHTEPTSCTENSCTWGPGSNALDPNTYKLVVTRNSNGSFDWELSAQSKTTPTAPFSPILFGNAVPSGQRHRGSGTFTIDFDAAAQLSGHSDDRGNVTIEYSNVGPAHVVAHFNGVKDQQNASQTGNAYYNYQQDVTGGGDMEIAWHNLSTNERIDIHSRWKADGAGRADLIVLQTPTEVRFSNCWSAALAGFVTVYSPTSGSVSACTYADAAFGTHMNDAP